MTVFLFSHNDLDGAAPVVLAKKCYKNLSAQNCGYDNIDDKVNELLDYISDGTIPLSEMSHLYITDISVNEETAKRIDSLLVKRGAKVDLFDHHVVDHLIPYSWAHVTQFANHEDTGILGFKGSSGTYLFYKFLVENGKLSGKEARELLDFVFYVTKYDTYEWKSEGIETSKQLNNLYYLLGRLDFISRFSSNPSVKFTESEELLLSVEKHKEEEYIRNKLLNHRVISYDGDTIGVVFAENYISEVANTLLDTTGHLDYAMVINLGRKSISLRSLPGKTDVGAVARKLGGGGRENTAGVEIRESIVQSLVPAILTSFYKL